MWYTGWSLLILQKCLMFLIFFLSLLIIIFIWNYFKRVKHYSMEKVTRGLLESFHECLISKNYIRSRKRKVSQAERHSQQVQSKLDSTLLIPSASYGTHCSVCPCWSWTTEGYGTVKESWWTVPFLCSSPGLLSTCLCCLNLQQQSKKEPVVFHVGWLNDSKLLKLFWSSFVPPLLSLKCSLMESPFYKHVSVSEPLVLLCLQEQLSHRKPVIFHSCYNSI